jgi:glutamate formiminotransferase/formiminotetrahydrofolate cyclodeaminase
VANLTVGKKAYADVQERVKDIAERGQDLKDRLLKAMDDDTAAFNKVMDTFRLPKGTPAEKQAKGLAEAAATRLATTVPLSVLELCPEVLELAGEVAEIGNANSLSDAGVAALMALAGAEGAYYNVLINLDSLKALDPSEDPDFLPRTLEAAKAALARCEALHGRVSGAVRGRLEKALD